MSLSRTSSAGHAGCQRLRRGLSGWAADTLYNRVGATNVFTNSARTFTVTFGALCPLTTNVDYLDATVTQTSLGLNGASASLIETNGTSKVFQADPELSFADDYRAWTFSVGAATPGEASTGGTFKSEKGSVPMNDKSPTPPPFDSLSSFFEPPIDRATGASPNVFWCGETFLKQRFWFC